MTSFIIGVISGLAGMIIGYLVKHIQDSRFLNELCSDVVRQAKELDLQEIEIRELKKEVNRYNELRAMKEVRVKPTAIHEFIDVFNEISKDLPDRFKDDVDFGGNF